MRPGDVTSFMPPHGVPPMNHHHQQQMNPIQMMAMQQQQAPPQTPQRQVASPMQKVPVSSSSPLAFTPTSVIRKMTAKKEENKATLAAAANADRAHEEAVSPPSTGASSTAAVSNRLTGRTASQVQGAARVSNQLGMNEAVSLVLTSSLAVAPGWLPWLGLL